MKALKTLLTFAFLLLGITLSYAQPVNDLCVNATGFGTLPSATQVCLPGTNVAGNPEFPYPSQSNCTPAGTQATPAADVWFSFTASENELVVQLTGSTLANPNVAIYSGGCGSLTGLGCGIGTGPHTFAPLVPGNTYWVQVSGGNPADQGTFNLCLTNNNNSNICMVQSNLVVTPSPVNGTYAPGDTVDFCYTINTYIQQAANWFHGLTFNFGNGWSPTGLHNQVPATSCDGNGNWDWYNVVTGSATGFTTGPGFFYDSNSGGPLDGNPGNNFGDSNPGSCTWTFCFSLVARTDSCSFYNDLSIVIEHWGDGQTGSWTSFACAQDPDYNFSSILQCCQPPSITTTQPCPGACNGSITATPVGSAGPFSILWSNGATTNTINNLCAGVYNVSVADSDSCVVIQTVILNPLPAMTFTTSSVDANCGGPTGSATVTPAGGTGSNYTYAWSNGQTTQTINNLVAGTYFVTVTDSLGCTGDTSVTVVASGFVTASITGSVDVSCNGGTDGSATASVAGGTPPYSYFWIPGGQTTATAINLPAGNYSVIVTDTFGQCRDTATVTINQPTLLNLTGSTQPATCFGQASGSATVVATGATPPYTYAWSTTPTQTGATANNLLAGSYSCTVTDANGCQDSITLTVIEPTQVVAAAFGQDVTCTGFTNGSAFAVVSGGIPPYTYLWNTGSTNTSLNNLPVGTYTVTATDANGCSATASVTVGAGPSPVANAGPDIAVCDGEGGDTLLGSASGGTPGYFYTWTCNAPICGLSAPFSQNPNANPTVTTTYYLQVTDINGCPSNIDSMVVTVLPKPIVDAGPDLYICGQPAPGAQISASVSNSPGPFTYQWTPAAGLNNPNILSPFARPDTTTIYTLVVTDLTTGCTSDFTTVDTLSSVVVHVAPTPIANAGPDRSICLGDSIQLQGFGFGAGPAYTFEWSPYAGLSNPSIPNPMASPSQTTEYILTVWSNGCPSFGDTLRLTVNTNPTVDAGPDRDRCYGDAAMLDGQAGGVPGGSNFQYFWTPGLSLNDSTIEDPMAMPTITTMYYLQVMSDSGCISAIDSVLFTVRPTPIANAGPDVVYCPGSGDLFVAGSFTWENNNAPGDLSNVNVRWEPSNYIIGANNQDTVQINPPSTMFFYYTVTYDSCFHTDSMLVTVLPEIIATVEADTNIICEGDSVQLHVSGGLGGGTVLWSPVEGLSSATVADPMASPATSTTYSVILSEAGCSDTASVDIEVIPLPDMSYLSSITSGCAPFTVHFMENSANATFLVWNFGDGSPISNQDNPIHTYEAPGTYTVTLQGFGEGGCTSSISDLVVNVIDFPEPEFTSTPNFPVQLHQPNTAVQFTDLTQSDVVSWLWEFGTGNNSGLQDPSFVYTQPGEYFVTLTVTNEFGCEGSVTHGPYIVMTPELFIPNVFTPNGDGINERYMIQYTGDQPFTIQIFDRWGVQQYESRNKVEGWDGMLKGKRAAEGVYYYVVTIGDKDYNGELTLLR